MIVTFDEMFGHRHLQRNLLARFAALIFPPGFQPIAAQIGTRLIHQTNPRLALQLITMLIIAHVGFRHRRDDIQQ
ncbi:hypothetical protein D3C81_1985000 [compost metagenome]